MRRWWMAAAVAVMMLVGRVEAFEHTFKDPDSGATVAVVIGCNDCKSGQGAGCDDGSEAGWFDGKPCGKCLVDSNYGTTIRYPYDVHLVGILTDAEGQPVKDRFVKMFLPNGWGVRTRTMESGAFRMTLGATGERTKKEPVVINIGTHIDSTKGADDPHFALYLLPENYKPCAADAAAGGAEGKKPAAPKAAPKAPKK